MARQNVRALAKTLAANGWLPVPLLTGVCYPKDNWWKEPAERRDASALIAEERFAEAGTVPGLAIVLDPEYGLVHVDVDLDIRRNKQLYEKLETRFPGLASAPAYRTPGGHQNYLVRCPSLGRSCTLSYSYIHPYKNKRLKKTAFELRPAGNLFPIAGSDPYRKRSYRAIRPLPAQPEQVPEFTLEELEQMFRQVQDYLRATRPGSRVYVSSGVSPLEARRVRGPAVIEGRGAASRALAGNHASPVAGPVATFADLAARICRDLDLLDDLFHEFGVQVARPGKYVHCPFHGPDRTPSMSIFTDNEGQVWVQDWHAQDRVDYDIPALHYALRTGEPGTVERNDWCREVALIGRKCGLLPSEDEVRSRLKPLVNLMAEEDVWEGATEASVRHLRNCFQFLYEEAVTYGNLYTPVSARVVAERLGVDVKVANRAVNLLCVLRVAEKGPREGKSDVYRLNPDLAAEQVRNAVKALVEAGYPDLLSANQNVIAAVLDPELAFRIYRRQSDRWEAERKLPAWRRQFMTPEEQEGKNFVEVPVRRGRAGDTVAAAPAGPGAGSRSKGCHCCPQAA